jgi:hypothetical protein
VNAARVWSTISILVLSWVLIFSSPEVMEKLLHAQNMVDPNRTLIMDSQSAIHDRRDLILDLREKARLNHEGETTDIKTESLLIMANMVLILPPPYLLKKVSSIFR